MPLLRQHLGEEHWICIPTDANNALFDATTMSLEPGQPKVCNQNINQQLNAHGLAGAFPHQAERSQICCGPVPY